MANQTLSPSAAAPSRSRPFLGPALRTQSDGRLVRLVREGREVAFEEIVRRYRRPLDRFAAAIVGGRSEDVLQDSFSKALLALRRSDAEIELRPWLYRIVRNTALNDLRDRPPATEELGEDRIGGARSAAAEAESREEVGQLTAAMSALPGRQRSAIVMRELEGRSHEEIAGALGVSDGAARQAIHRARATLRAGFGAFVPLPLLRILAGHGGAADATAGSAAVGAGGALGAGSSLGAASSLGAGGSLGAAGIGAGGALKLGLATALIAGGVGAGVAVDHHGGRAATAAVAPTVAPQHRVTASAGSGAGGALGGPTLVASFDPPSGAGSGHRDHRHGDDSHKGRGGADPGDSGSGSDSGEGRSPGGSTFTGGGDDSGATSPHSGRSGGGPDSDDRHGSGSGSGSGQSGGESGASTRGSKSGGSDEGSAGHTSGSSSGHGSGSDGGGGGSGASGQGSGKSGSGDGQSSSGGSSSGRSSGGSDSDDSSPAATSASPASGAVPTGSDGSGSSEPSVPPAPEAAPADSSGGGGSSSGSGSDAALEGSSDGS